MKLLKSEGQVFTPNKIVKIILDSVGYIGKDAIDKKIMEPSFGNGAFLTEIAKRLIAASKYRKDDAIKTSQLLNDRIYGIEKDKDLYREAISALNNICEKQNIPVPEWKNLICDNTLSAYKTYAEQMDYCVGNPPYVRVHTINEDDKKLIKDFKYTKGNTDLYIAFYEVGLEMLNDKGILSYITPSSFLKNSSQDTFRRDIIENNLLSAIYSFEESEIFDVQAYTCVCVLDKNTDRDNIGFIDYLKYKDEKISEHRSIAYPVVNPDQPSFRISLDNESNIAYITENQNRPKKLCGIANIQNGISTNSVKVYNGDAYLDKIATKPYTGNRNDEHKIIWFNGCKIESDILLKCIKASTYSKNETYEYIIFPYKSEGFPPIFKKSSPKEQIDARYIPYTEKELKTKFPLAYNYLKTNSDLLDKRNLSPYSEWFHFARSQGIQNTGYKKIIFGHIIKKGQERIKAYLIDENIAIYSGLSVTLNPNEYTSYTKDKAIFDDITYEKDLKRILNIIKSKDFYEYCTIAGKYMRNGYVHVYSNMIKNYGLMEK